MPSQCRQITTTSPAITQLIRKPLAQKPAPSTTKAVKCHEASLDDLPAPAFCVEQGSVQHAFFDHLTLVCGSNGNPDTIPVARLEFYLNTSNQHVQIHSNITMSPAQSSHAAAGAPNPDLIPNLPSYQLATSGLPGNYILPPMRAILPATTTFTLPGTN
ncbi:hypothetical protein PSTT_06557 [Puccinia striiformis]|uniref:Uncharacterized protein n=1 Tax=Puccinia striiformis TaxID=27350 RepID=A0A2S4VJQ4_9BASI|nr:hypothetical protein PSTT_06557 [Puccinia striiformis]